MTFKVEVLIKIDKNTEWTFLYVVTEHLSTAMILSRALRNYCSAYILSGYNAYTKIIEVKS
jgi:hypothetical protein